MKKIIIAFLTVACVTNLCFASNRVVATYKGGEIKEEEIEKEFSQMWNKIDPALKGKKFTELPCALQENITNLAVRTKLLAMEAKNKGIRDTSEFKDKIATISNRLEQELLVQDILKTVNIDPSKIKASYDDFINKNKGKKEREASHILVKTEKEAEEVSAQLRKGGKFAELAKKYSIDDASKNNGGVLGSFVQGQGLPKDIEDAIFQLKINEISKPIKTESGYHIIRVTLEKPLTMPTMEQLKPTIENQIKGEALENYFNELYKKVDLKIILDCKKESVTEEKKS